MDQENIITLKDEETGKTQSFFLDDKFLLNGNVYVSLIVLPEGAAEDPDFDFDDLPEEIDLVIMKVTEGEDGEDLLSTLDEEEEDIVFDYYDKLCEMYDDEEEDEEGDDIE